MKQTVALIVVIFAFAVHTAAATEEFWPTDGASEASPGSTSSVSKISSLASSRTPSPSPKTHKPSHVSTSVSSSSSRSLHGSSSASGLSSLSGSGDMMYACVCSDLRKVSLMGASNYCLFPDAYVDNKCGNVNLEGDGECPRAGAQPCSDAGHVLMSDSICTKVSGIYKCVASDADVKAQKQSSKKKKKNSKKSSSTSGSGNGDVLVRSSDAMRSSLAVAVFTLSMAVGAALLL